MTRLEIEKAVEPIISDCLRRFGDWSRPDVSAEEFGANIGDGLRPDVRRVSLLISLTKSIPGGEISGEGLELGCGYGFLLFPMAIFNPKVHWTGIEHPGRRYFNRADFRQTFSDHNCSLVGLDFVHEPLPFPDGHFSVVTFSETLEHMPIERLFFVLGEISRVLRPGGLLIASSPNQSGLENRLRLLKGGSILDLPEYLEVAEGIFKHIRLYTTAEMKHLMGQLGFRVERWAMESNNSAYRGKSPTSMYRRMYRLYERAEQRLSFLRGMADTWYIVFRKDGSAGA